MYRVARILVLGAVVLAGFAPAASAQEAKVRAIMFYSPSCPHCHTVITETMPPILDEYAAPSRVFLIEPTEDEEAYGPPVVALMGNRLELLYVNAVTLVGAQLFESAIEWYEIPEERHAVPTLIVGDTTLLGDIEIAEEFPPLVAEGLAAGGVDWPPLEGFEGVLADLVPAPTPEPPEEGATDSGSAGGSSGAEETAAAAAGSTSADQTDTPEGDQSDEPDGAAAEAEEGVPPDGDASAEPIDSGDEENLGSEDTQPQSQDVGPLIVDASEMPWRERYMLDPLGNSISVVVLVLLIASVVGVWRRWNQQPSAPTQLWLSYAVPLICVVGIGVAGYMSYVETTGVTAACGPVGDCNSVQQSSYAMLFGVLPVAVLGLVGYVVIAAAWFVAEQRRGDLSRWASVAMFGLTVFGVGFSIYLTFLEPFVIGASCAWCLTSAVLITLLMWLAVDPAAAAWRELRAT